MTTPEMLQQKLYHPRFNWTEAGTRKQYLITQQSQLTFTQTVLETIHKFSDDIAAEK